MISVAAFTFSPLQENTYVLHNEHKEALLIDPGCYFTAEQEQLMQFLTEQGLQPTRLLNTHCHLDHVFGNKWVYETFGLELHLHPMEEKVLAFAPASGQMWGLNFDNYAGPLHFLNDGDEVLLGEDRLEVILAPGHSPGSICFYCPAQHFLIGGDVLFRESIGRTDLPGGDHATLIKSIRERLFVLPNDTTVYSGHGPATTIAHEKANNPFLNGVV
jgi:glyoxylase-like metal-dependent hydrolase (beta-lactamase superfamily II)